MTFQFLSATDHEFTMSRVQKLIPNQGSCIICHASEKNQVLFRDLHMGNSFDFKFPLKV